MKFLSVIICVALAWNSCKSRNKQTSSSVRDTGWVSNSSVEVESVMTGTVTTTLSSELPRLDTDQTQQEKLVDMQVKFAKVFFHDRNIWLNQVPEKVSISSVKKDGQTISITYSAVIDVLLPVKGAQPTLESLGTTNFSVPVPVNPVQVLQQAHQTCAKIDDPKRLTEYNYYYYFTPEKDGCLLSLTQNKVSFTKIYPIPTKVYPEYDKLMLNLGEPGVGFHAAIIPDSEDEDGLTRYNAHISPFKDEGLVGVPSADQTYTRFVWKNGPAAAVIDVFNPTKADPESIFKRALGKYEYVFFNGHSVYGTREFVADRSVFSTNYQVVVLHSCRSYPYYARQVFKAKSSEKDPAGYSLADVVATGETSYPWDSPVIMMITLRNLLEGITAVAQKTPAAAPDWNTIATEMNEDAPNIFYGISGVRTNSWRP